MPGFSLMRFFRIPHPSTSPHRQEPPAPRLPEERAKNSRTWLSRLRRNTAYQPDAPHHAFSRSAFAPYQPPPGVVPEGCQTTATLGMDGTSPAAAGINGWAMAQTAPQPSWMADGLGFLGYPTLAQMAQNAASPNLPPTTPPTGSTPR